MLALTTILSGPASINKQPADSEDMVQPRISFPQGQALSPGCRDVCAGGDYEGTGPICVKNYEALLEEDTRGSRAT